MEMTNIRAAGFDSPAQLREHLADLDDEERPADAQGEISGDPLSDIEREIAWLRKEVEDLRERVDWLFERDRTAATASRGTNPWLRIAITALSTVVIGGLLSRLRLGAAGAAAVPMIVSELGRRLR